MEEKKNKTVNSLLQLKKKYNDIEDLKNDLVELNKEGVDIVQSDVVSALVLFEMSDDEIDQFYDWTSSVGIDLIDTSNDSYKLLYDDFLSSLCECSSRSRLSENSETDMFMWIEYDISHPEIPFLELHADMLKHDLIFANHPQVTTITEQYCRGGNLISVLLPEGISGLHRSFENFDYRKGYSFYSFAAFWIHYSIARAIRNFCDKKGDWEK